MVPCLSVCIFIPTCKFVYLPVRTHACFLNHIYYFYGLSKCIVCVMSLRSLGVTGCGMSHVEKACCFLGNSPAYREYYMTMLISVASRILSQT